MGGQLACGCSASGAKCRCHRRLALRRRCSLTLRPACAAPAGEPAWTGEYPWGQRRPPVLAPPHTRPEGAPRRCQGTAGKRQYCHQGPGTAPPRSAGAQNRREAGSGARPRPRKCSTTHCRALRGAGAGGGAGDAETGSSSQMQPTPPPSPSTLCRPSCTAACRPPPAGHRPPACTPRIVLPLLTNGRLAFPRSMLVHILWWGSACAGLGWGGAVRTAGRRTRHAEAAGCLPISLVRPFFPPNPNPPTHLPGAYQGSRPAPCRSTPHTPGPTLRRGRGGAGLRCAGAGRRAGWAMPPPAPGAPVKQACP